MKDKMNKERYNDWVENSGGLAYVDMLLIGNAQGLGLLDVELIKEFPKIKIISDLEEDRLNKLRHITISELWVLGAYELIRVIDEITSTRKDEINVEVIKKIKENLTLFTELRVPLAKFQKSGKKELFSGLSSKCEFDEKKGLGWKIISRDNKKIELKRFYRRDLGDNLLELLKMISDAIRTGNYVARK